MANKFDKLKRLAEKVPVQKFTPFIGKSKVLGTQCVYAVDLSKERFEEVIPWTGFDSSCIETRKGREALCRFIAAADPETVLALISAWQAEVQRANDAEDSQMAQVILPAGPARRSKVRKAHAAWSEATFGPSSAIGPIGPLKHLSLEALEAAANPEDLSEWADIQFLFWDAQRRAGITDGQLTTAMEQKLEVLKVRKYPAPKDGEPRLHIKEEGEI